MRPKLYPLYPLVECEECGDVITPNRHRRGQYIHMLRRVCGACKRPKSVQVGHRFFSWVVASVDGRNCLCRCTCGSVSKFPVSVVAKGGSDRRRSCLSCYATSRRKVQEGDAAGSRIMLAVAGRSLYLWRCRGCKSESVLNATDAAQKCRRCRRSVLYDGVSLTTEDIRRIAAAMGVGGATVIARMRRSP
jgi:hypothetical protein